MERVLKSSTAAFLKGGGEMGTLIRNYDWSATPLGAPEQWPQVLRSTIGILLNSKFPMFLFWGPDAICFYNDAYRPSLGNDGKHPRALGKPGREIWTEIWVNIQPQINAILAGGEATWHEDQLLPIYRNGRLEDVYWTYSYSPVLDETGNPAGVFVTCTETTKTVQLISQMKDSNEKLRLAIEAGDLGVVEVDLVTEAVIISKRIEDIFQLVSGSERTAFLKQMHPDDLLLRDRAYKQALKDGRLEYESRVFRADGSVRWLRLKGTVFFDSANKPLKMVSVVQDITDQKEFSATLSKQVKERTEELEKTHQQLLTSNAYLQNLINIFTTPLQVLEPVIEKGHVVDFIYKLTNEAYAIYANKKPAELEGKRVSQFFPGYFTTDSFKNIREVATTGEARLWDNHYAADGLDIYNEMGAVKLGNDVVVHLTDYTKLKHLQLELERNNSELKRSNVNLEEFAYAASHDMKEPIRKIHFFMDRLRLRLSEKLTEEDLGYFARMQAAAQRMSTLIDDLLTYSHISGGINKEETVDLNQTIQLVIEDMELILQEKDGKIVADSLPTLQGHRRQLQQLFENLIGNGLKYSKPGVPPLITIRSRLVRGGETGIQVSATEEHAPFHLIQVADNGIGFEQADAERIFNVFTRLHGLTEYKGTGVGLSIVRKVAENHNGYIWAESQPGEGATFSVLLPAE